MRHKLTTAGPGRPPGTPNRVTRDVREMVRRALKKAGGEAYLVRQAKANPKAFLTLVAKLIPSDVKATLEGNIDIKGEVVLYLPDNGRGDGSVRAN